MTTTSHLTTLERFLSDMQGVGAVLLNDLQTARTRLSEILSSGKDNAEIRSEAGFWTKTTIRCLMGFVDGVSYTMRMAVAEYAKQSALALSNKELARLREKRYNSARDRVLANNPALLSTEESFKLAFRYYPRLFGLDYALDTGGEQWRAFKRLARIRHSFTHPKTLEDLAFHNALPVLLPTLEWISATYLELLEKLASAARLPVREHSPLAPAFRERDAPWVTIFSDEDMVLIRSRGSRSLQYVSRMFQIIGDETKRAMGLVSGAQGYWYQFSYRTYARALFSEIEGTVSACRFFLEAGAGRGEARLSDSERKALNTGEIEDKLVVALNLWAREYGRGYKVPRLGKGWKELRGARFFRNRITHPKRQDSLMVDPTTASTILKAHGFLIDHLEATHIDIDKWTGKTEALLGIGDGTSSSTNNSAAGNDEAS